MKTYENIAPSPWEESCVQLKTGGEYENAMREEVNRFVQLLKTVFPWAEENGLKIWRKSFKHDFGTYYEAIVIFDEDDEKACSLACFIIDNYPKHWTDDTVIPIPEKTLDSVVGLC